jgi:DNA-binding MarR family transcriptional regulator
MYGNDVTLSKLCKALAWSVSTISAALDRLRDKGVINKNGFKFTTEYLKKGSDDE